MKYNLISDQEPSLLQPRRNLKTVHRCALLVFCVGIIFYCLNSSVQRIPAREVTSVRLEFDNSNSSYFSEESLNINVTEDLDWQHLFYNRVPKCGSTTLYYLMRRLSLKHHFKHIHSTIYDKRAIDEKEQLEIVKTVKSRGTSSFDRHVFFIDFTKFGEQSPVYMNIIREPVERIISSFYYRRTMARRIFRKKPPSDYWLKKEFKQCVLNQDPECTFTGRDVSAGKLQVPYFCGQDPQCMVFNNPWALNIAKQNIEKYYAVVGVLEDMNVTLQVLDTMLPKFFGGALKIYHVKGVHQNKNSHKDEVPEEVKAFLRVNLTVEYELYHFVRQRLYRQYKYLIEDKENSENIF